MIGARGQIIPREFRQGRGKIAREDATVRNRVTNLMTERIKQCQRQGSPGLIRGV